MDTAADIPPPAEARPAGGTVLAKLVGVFAIIGFGLGVGTVLFLWVSGVFEPVPPGALEGLGQAIAGGLVVSAALVFSLLIGVVVSAVAGMHAASVATSRSSAALVGGVASALGQVAMIVVLGAVLIGGINLLRSESETEPRSSPSLIDRIDERVDEAAEEDTDVTVRELSRLALGVVPAFIVGTLSAALVFSRRSLRRQSSP